MLATYYYIDSVGLIGRLAKTEAMPESDEKRLASYEVIKKIGSGRFGEVFLVKQKVVCVCDLGIRKIVLLESDKLPGAEGERKEATGHGS